MWPTDLPREQREPWGRLLATAFLDGMRGFEHSDSGHTFDYPFYFGLIRGLTFLLAADRDASLRFVISPSGGGPALIPGQSNPAWDLVWAPTLALDQGQTIHIRLVYKRPVWLKYEVWQAGAGGPGQRPSLPASPAAVAAGPGERRG